MGKPGSGKTTLGKLLEKNISDSLHFSFGELLKSIQQAPTAEGYTLDDRQAVYDFLKEESKKVTTLIIDGNPYPPTNFDRRKQLDDLFENVFDIHIVCDDEVALTRLNERGRELLAHEGSTPKDRIQSFNTIVLPEIEKAKQVYSIKTVDTSFLSPSEICKKIEMFL